MKTAAVAVFVLLASAGSAWAETPLEDWVFAPDYAIPLVENHFGVLSLEGFGLANKTSADVDVERSPIPTSISQATCTRVSSIGVE